MTSFNTIRMRVFAILAAGLFACLPAFAASPAFVSGGPVRILVGFPAGGTIDVVARLLAEQMHRDLGVQVLVENTTGAGGQLAAVALKRATPDGHTLMVAPDHTMVVIPLTIAQPGFEIADFAPVGEIATYVGALAVGAGSDVKDIDGFIKKVRADPKLGSVGIAAAGSKPQFALLAISREKGVALTPVPYRGSVPMVQDLVGGHLPAGITALGDFLEQHAGGQLRVIAITNQDRTSQLPTIPTALEQGYPMKLNFWLGMFAPAKTPADILDMLSASMTKALGDPQVMERMKALAFDPHPSSPAEMTTEIQADTKYWAPLVEASGWVKQ
ncbi:tripartite tricarboxylate transporter substrate-binding protein [Roseiarcaceae bacterium H3SJ34-1]|uniref:tripartite tricarboxylate transporter substrate-binding protein n=1 Tax=Terripilifer ovatus TaxID=3032367 RepID=UPI003AB9BBAA|nr:tripartite tricarboxylate transporter substrate-binding protein [Roseiarcaceae bacterium H3SJ34-1]